MECVYRVPATGVPVGSLIAISTHKDDSAQIRRNDCEWTYGADLATRTLLAGVRSPGHGHVAHGAKQTDRPA